MKKILVLILFSILIFSCKNNPEPVNINYFDRDTLTFKLFKVDSGWGYKIFKNNRLFIYQDIIPAVNGHFVFKKPEQAKITAKYVIKKMTEKAGLPSVSVQELDSLGVLDSQVINYQKIDFSTKNPESLKLLQKK